MDAVPFGGQRRGADGGIDGHIYFKPDGRRTEKAIVSVKGGDNVSVAMIRDLGHVVAREDAKIGVFITLAPPTRPMVAEATRAGFYDPPQGGPVSFGRVPKIQIITIAELLSGRQLQIPATDKTAFRRTARESSDRNQGTLI